MAQMLTEAELLKKLRDPALTPPNAAKYFYLACGPLLLAYLGKQKVPAQEIDDLVQDTCVAVLHRYRDHKGYLEKEGGTSPKTWFFTVANLEKKMAHRASQKPQHQLTPADDQKHIHWARDEQPSPSERTRHRVLAERAREALDVLKPHERRAILLDALDFTAPEIAELEGHGTRVGTVYRWLSEARAKLRAALGEPPAPGKKKGE